MKLKRERKFHHKDFFFSITNIFKEFDGEAKENPIGPFLRVTKDERTLSMFYHLNENCSCLLVFEFGPFFYDS